MTQRTSRPTGVISHALTSAELDYVSGGIVAPRDPSTGMATGRRVEKPIRITTPVGTDSAILF